MALPEIHCTQVCRFEEATPMKISHQRVLDHKIFHNFSTPINPNFPVPYWEIVGYSGCFQAIARRKARSEEHTSELQSLMRISYAVFCLKKKTTPQKLETRAKYYIQHIMTFIFDRENHTHNKHYQYY